MNIFKQEYGLVAALSILCLAVAMLLALEWAWTDRSAQTIQARLNTPAESALEPELPVDDDFQMHPKGRYAQQVERPLFVQGRRPLPKVADNTPDKPVVAPAKKTKLNIKLMGVIDIPKGRLAMIYDVRKRVYRRLKEGQQMDGWRLAALSPGKAVFRQGVAREEVLLRKPKPKHLPRKARAKRAKQRSPKRPPR